MRIPVRGKLRLLEAGVAVAALAAVPAVARAQGQSQSPSKPATSAPTHWGWYEPKPAPAPAPKKGAPKKGAPAQKPQKPSTTTSVGGGTAAGQAPVTSTVTKTAAGAEVQQVSVPGVSGGARTLVDQQTETTRLNAHTTRTTTKIYGQDTDGNRRLIAVRQTDKTDLGGGKSREVTNYSERDQNDQFGVTRRTVSETVPTGPHSETTNVSVFTPAGEASGQMALSQKIHEVTHKRKDGERTVSTLSRPDGNGSWAPTRKTETTVQKHADGTKTEEKNLYLTDANGTISLSQRVVTRDWKAKDGKEHKTVSTYVTPPGATMTARGGGLELMQRVSTVKTVKKDGTIETRQQTAQRSLVAPSEGLKISGAVVDVASPTKSGTMRTQRTVYGENGNGQLQQVTVFGGEQPTSAAASSKPSANDKKEKEGKGNKPATKKQARKPAQKRP